MTPEEIDTYSKEFSCIEAAVVSDVLQAMGLYNRVVSSEFQTSFQAASVNGPVITVKGKVTAPAESWLPTFAMDDAIKPGYIVMIDTLSCTSGAVIGDNMVTSMMNKGAKGFVVDGGIRDLESFKDNEIPVFYRYASPINAHRTWHLTAINEQISISGIDDDVLVEHNDWLIADMDGAVVIPGSHIDKVLQYAKVHQETEDNIKKALLSGKDRQTASAENPRLEHVKKIN